MYLSLIKLLPTICFVHCTDFGGEDLSLLSWNSQSSWQGAMYMCKVCVICVYLGTRLCSRTYRVQVNQPDGSCLRLCAQACVQVYEYVRSISWSGHGSGPMTSQGPSWKNRCVCVPVFIQVSVYMCDQVYFSLWEVVSTCVSVCVHACFCTHLRV